jgi:hypothetical protein
MTNTLSASGPVNATPNAAQIAASVLGEIEWASDVLGYCECPGKKSHTSKDGGKDCVIYLDRVPTVSCFHGSCKTAVDAANKRLRAAILNPTGDAEYQPRKLTVDERERIQVREKNARLQLRARKALPTILKKHRCLYGTMLNESPVNVRDNEADHWKLLLSKFKPDDVVWIGERESSGKPENAVNFRTVVDWLKCEWVPHPFICPATFKNNSSSRSNDMVLERRFVVVESDELTRDEVGAVFRYLIDCGLKLVAVVDTAGKSLHGWFEYPGDEMMDALRLLLPALKCDPKMLTASQPARLPSAMRGEKRQRLVYLERN